MSLEEALRQTLEQADGRGCKFEQQMQNFKNFEKQMVDGGYHIEREKFSIPLMDRVSTSYLYR